MNPKNSSSHPFVAGLSLAALAPILLSTSSAAVATWTGATAEWNAAGNWSGTNTPPLSGDSLVFGAAGAGGTALNNNLTSAGFSVAGITYNAGGSAFAIGGNDFTLTGGITNNGAAQTINNAITLSGNQSFGVATAAGTLTLGGTISGAGVTLTTSGGSAAGVPTVTTFTGAVTLANLLSQGNSANNPSSAPQAAGLYTAEQTTTFNNAALAISGNARVGRSNLVFAGNTTATITGSITSAGATSTDWASVKITGAANVTAASLNMTGSVATGQFYLDGGTLTVGSISAIDSTNGTLPVRNVFNGTQVVASQSNPSFLTVTKSAFFTGSNEAFVGNNGALFNTNGFNIGTATSFVNDTGATGILTKSGAGTLTLSGASTYTGATTVAGGTLRVNGSLAAESAVAVNGGAALGGTGTVNGAVTLASGSTAGTQGAINLVDGGINTLTLSNAAGLALGGTAGNLAKLEFEAGASSADQLSLGANPLTVDAGGATISITGSGIAAGSTYDLITFGSGTGAGYAMGNGTTVGALTLANPNLTFGVSGTLNVTDTAVQLVTSGSAAPTIAYWSGVQGTSWTSVSGASGNFTTNANGTGFVGAYPNNLTDVIFAANGNGAPANLTNTLGQDFGVFSLTFAAGTGPTHISGANQLDIDAGGITLQSGNGGATLAMDALALASSQVWTNASANDLLVSAVVSGTNGLVIDNTGSGSTVLSAANTYSGGTTLQSGSLRLSGSGTLGATTGSLTIDAGVLDLNGTSQSVGSLSGTGGTIVNNSTGTGVTLTIGAGNAAGGDYQGIIADHTSGTGTVALTKTGNGTQLLSGANAYSGKTTIEGGSLIVGSGENIPDVSVVEINNGGKLAVQAFTETIAGLSSTAGDLNVVQNFETGSTGAGVLVIDTAGNDFTFTGIVRDNFGGTGTLALVKNGAGTQTVKCTNGLGAGTSTSFSGGATVNGGALLLSDNGNGKVIGSFASDVTLTAAGASLTFENTASGNTQTFGKVIGGSGNVVVTASNAGTVALSQANTYTGSTTVAGGTLSLAQPYLADGSTVSISGGAVLNLTHAGVDVVGSLFLGGVEQLDGIYDSSTPGGFISGSGKIQVGVVAGYAGWAATNAGGQGPDLDFDGDGMANGVEFFMNAAAGFTANPALVSGTISWTNGGNIPASAYGSQFVIQSSSDLTIWTDVPIGNLTSNTDGPDGAVSFTPPSDQGKYFIRLSVTPN